MNQFSEEISIGIIDNDPINNVKLAEILDRLGYKRVHWFFSSEDCYEMLETGLQLDLLIISWEFEHENIDSGLCSKLRICGFNSPIIFIVKSLTQTINTETTDSCSTYQTSCHDKHELSILKTTIYKYGVINVLIKPYLYEKVYPKIQSAKKIILNRKRARLEAQKPNPIIFKATKKA